MPAVLVFEVMGVAVAVAVAALELGTAVVGCDAPSAAEAPSVPSSLPRLGMPGLPEIVCPSEVQWSVERKEGTTVEG